MRQQIKTLLIDTRNLALTARYSKFKKSEDLPEDPFEWRSVFASRAIELMTNLGGDNCIFFIDSPPYVRSESFPQYKAHRTTGTDVGHAQWCEIRDDLQRSPYLITSAVPGYEADDLIARFVERSAKHQTHRLLICSADKDLRQLLGKWDNVVMWSMSKAKWITVEPDIDQCRLLAMTGDASDGIPGVTGEITALKLLRGPEEDRALFLAKEYKPKQADLNALKLGLIKELPKTNAEVYKRNLGLVTLTGPAAMLVRPPLPPLPTAPIDLLPAFRRFLGRPTWEPEVRPDPGEDKAADPTVLTTGMPPGFPGQGAK